MTEMFWLIVSTGIYTFLFLTGLGVLIEKSMNNNSKSDSDSFGETEQ